MSEPTVLFETQGGPKGVIGRITLNRPKALNALTLDQIRRIDPQMRAWADDPSVAAVVIEGTGDKAFCAGGDIRALHDAAKAGDGAFLADFFGNEYRLNRLIKVYGKPYVALIDGITMGGGVGLSVHGRYRVATERTVFAMPETGIGFFPDVGGTFALSRCPGQIGLYLGLTGARLKAADALYAGIATHFVPSAELPALVAALTEEADPANADATVRAVLGRFHRDPGPAPLADRRALIDRLFAGLSLEAVVRALDADPDPWAAATLATIRQKSPTACAITFSQLRTGPSLSFDESMQFEYALAQRATRLPDFVEGVRSVIIDKDNQPRWQPPGIDGLSAMEVETVFGPSPTGPLALE